MMQDTHFNMCARAGGWGGWTVSLGRDVEERDDTYADDEQAA